MTSGKSSINQAHVAMAAYYRAQQRGFAPGQELEDWLQAERELQNEPDSEDVSGS
jgi:transketolase N-terminal domain/subunit